MPRYWVAFLVALAPVNAAQGTEIEGVDSRAIAISISYNASDPPRDPQYGAAFASVDESGRSNGITVQSRHTEGSVGVAECSQTIPLPPNTRRITHPALSRSGWLFVSAETDRGWRLFATRRAPSLLEAVLGHCGGWRNGWDDLEAPPGRPVGSAPDAVVAYDVYTLVFVRDWSGQIHYRIFDADSSPGRNPARTWRRWKPLQATDPGRPGYNRQYYAASTPAVAIDNPNPQPEFGINYLHVFWLDSSLRSINHVRAMISWNGEFGEGSPDTRPLGRMAATACSAGPEIKAPNFLFVVCGFASGGRLGGYSIARYRNPHLPWSAGGAVELVNGQAWITRSAYGGTSAPSLGPTGGLGGVPIMFMTVGDNFCPQRRDGIPSPVCWQPGPWGIQNRWVRPRRLGAESLADWQHAGPAAPLN